MRVLYTYVSHVPYKLHILHIYKSDEKVILGRPKRYAIKVVKSGSRHSRRGPLEDAIKVMFKW